MRRFGRFLIAGLFAGGAIYLAQSYTVRPEGVSKEVAGPLRFIPGSAGPGIDDWWLGLAGVVGGAVGNKVGHMVLGGKAAA